MLGIEKVISGFQSGVDQAAIITANALGLATGGTICQGWMTEDGEARWAEDYGLVESTRPGYAARTETNIARSNGTLLITTESKLTGGSYQTKYLCENMDKPVLWIILSKDGLKTHSGVVHSDYKTVFETWVRIHGVKTLNVAGPRESKSPGIFEKSSELLMELLSL